MPSETKMRHSVNTPEDLHNAGKNNYQKVDSMFVNPGIAPAMISRADLENPEVSSSATSDLRSFIGGGQSMEREQNY